jgi:hypothetical protein
MDYKLILENSRGVLQKNLEGVKLEGFCETIADFSGLWVDF